MNAWGDGKREPVTEKYKEISEARKVLALPETATMATIRSSYRRLLAKWHPDTCKENPELCSEMTRKIVWAYETILDYCSRYEYSFSEKTVSRHIPLEKKCFDRFRDDPLWGKNSKPK